MGESKIDNEEGMIGLIAFLDLLSELIGREKMDD